MLQLLRIILNLPRLLRTRASLAVLFELILSAAVGVVLGLVTDNPFVGFAAGVPDDRARRAIRSSR